MKASSYISIGLVVALVLWLASGDLSGRTETAREASQTPVLFTPMKVRVRESVAEPITQRVVVQGQLEPWRVVDVRAETTGLVEEVPVAAGSRVRQGDILVRIDMGDRDAQKLKATAEVEKTRSFLAASQRLADKNLQSEEAIRAMKSDLAATEAQLAAVLLDIERTNIRAPFNGVLEDRQVEIGTLLERGDAVLTVVDDTRLKATAQVPQNSVAKLELGQKAFVQLMNQDTLEGTLSFISRQADPSTRSFRVEVDVSNPEQTLAAGISAVLVFPVEEVMGHFVSPSLLVLDDDGRVGIVTVDDGDTVVFYPVHLVRVETGGAWVTGLPPASRLVTFGQGFVRPGEKVVPIFESKG